MSTKTTHPAKGPDAAAPERPPYFWPDLYLALNPDVREAAVDPLRHYADHGRRRHRVPHPLLDASLLPTPLLQNPDGIVAAFLSGPADLVFHPLVDCAFMRRQDPSLDTAQACFAAIADPHAPLRVQPHPLFDPAFYREATPGRHYDNELIDYLIANPAAGEPHPLFDPFYFAATSGAGAPHEASLLRYLRSWQEFACEISPLIDLKFLNHQLEHAGPPHAGERGADPLSYALKHRIGTPDCLLHPHADQRIIQTCFANLIDGLDNAPEARIYTEVVRFIRRPRAAAAPAAAAITSIILDYKKPVYSMLSLAAFFNACPAANANAILVENGGEPLHYEAMLRHFAQDGRVRFLRPRANKFFGEGNNIAIDHADGDWLLLLNNDCFLTPGFGTALQARIAAEPGAGAIGALMLFPDGSVQELGGLVSDCGAAVQRCKGLPRGHITRRTAPERVEYVSAACMALSRAAIGAVAGFDPIYEPFYYEDTDLCRRLTAAGLPIIVDPSLVALHVENASTREMLGRTGLGTLIQRNREIFARRWVKDEGAGAYVRPTRHPHAVPAIAAAPRRPQAVVFTPFEFRTGGGERYLLSAAHALSRAHDVVLCGMDMFSRARVKMLLQTLGIPEFEFDVCYDPILLPRIARDPAVLFAMGNELIPQIAPIARRNLFHLQFPFPWRNVGYAHLDLIEGFDSILVNSSYTAEWTNRRLLEAGIGKPPPIVELPPPVRLCGGRKCRAAPSPGPLHVVTVGRFFIGGHSKRQDIFLKIIEEARQIAGTEIRATMIGSPATNSESQRFFESVTAQAAKLGVEVIVDAPQTELQSVLRSADVYVHCAGYGLAEADAPERMEHFGISIVEGIDAGCIPVVYAAGGAREVVAKARIGVTFDRVSVAAQHIARLCRPAARASARAGLDEAWLDSVSEDSFARNLLQLLDAQPAHSAAA